MKKSKRQRKIETAKRIVREEAKVLNRRKRIAFDFETTGKPKFKDIDMDKLDGLFRSELISAEPVKPLRYIVMAAISDKSTGEIFTRDSGTYHSDICLEFNISDIDRNFTFGFLDNFNIFLNREEAGEIAYKAGQCSEHYRNSLQSNIFRRIL